MGLQTALVEGAIAGVVGAASGLVGYLVPGVIYVLVRDNVGTLARPTPERAGNNIAGIYWGDAADQDLIATMSVIGAALFGITGFALAFAGEVGDSTNPAQFLPPQKWYDDTVDARGFGISVRPQQGSQVYGFN